ncbi:unnamed protein product [Periconia digitata]|uniref:Uncharacterized protein n=1 Tax=Periconia digitata TaxID=1303443 RepID=A0A9W4UDD1_9PLEO|nr:unnamed protein product [Periconia digitata]
MSRDRWCVWCWVLAPLLPPELDPSRTPRPRARLCTRGTGGEQQGGFIAMLCVCEDRKPGETVVARVIIIVFLPFSSFFSETWSCLTVGLRSFFPVVLGLGATQYRVERPE